MLLIRVVFLAGHRVARVAFALGVLAISVSCLQAAAPDFNLNGLGDVWELVYGVGRLSPVADTDGDGFTNAAEAQAGTHPFDARSRFAVAEAASAGAAVTLTWASQNGKRYQVLSASNLVAGNWSPETGLLAGNGGALSVTVPGGGAQKFYRVQVTDVDTDADGIPDWDELQIGYDPHRPDRTSMVSAISPRCRRRWRRRMS